LYRHASSELSIKLWIGSISLSPGHVSLLDEGSQPEYGSFSGAVSGTPSPGLHPPSNVSLRPNQCLQPKKKESEIMALVN